MFITKQADADLLVTALWERSHKLREELERVKTDKRLAGVTRSWRSRKIEAAIKRLDAMRTLLLNTEYELGD